MPDAIRRPRFDRDALRPGIVHLGLGAFARAHVAVYTDDVLGAAPGRDPAWGILGASLRGADTADALRPQDGLYAVLERGPVDRVRVIGALAGVVDPTQIPSLLDGPLLSDALRIVSLTITEKGYGRNNDTGGLDVADPAISADLAAPDRPRTAIGLLAEALRRRVARGAKPIAVMSCDNLADNGGTLARLVGEYASRARGDAVARAIADAAAFPATTVDRIVPATADADRDAVADALGGLVDRWPVVAEPFSQWVIEDRFPAGRPDWGGAGATLVDDVRPFEAAKLRMLNGAHTALACLGLLVGIGTVADAMAEPAFAAFAAVLMDDAADTLPPPPPGGGFDRHAYRDALLARFRNRRLPHRLSQIATDTSRKLAPRLLATIEARLAAGRPIDRHAVAVAAWLRILGGTDENGRAIALDDPAAATLRAGASAGPRDAAVAVLGTTALFGRTGRNERVVDAVAAALGVLRSTGARAAAAAAVGRGTATRPVNGG